MPTIEEIDQNFKSQTDTEGIVFVDCFHSPMRISGLAWKEQNQNYHRLEDSKNEFYNFGLRGLSPNTAGVQVSFRSNTKRMGFKFRLEWNNLMPHMPANASSGVDVYIGSGKNKKFAKAVFSYIHEECVEQVAEFDGEMHEFTVNMPLYSGVSKMEIGFEPGSVIEPPTPFAIKKPVLFYGSSITQGGCASHPGNAYTNILTRMLDFEAYNLGFSGSAHGEAFVAEQIATLDLACFVLDYDYNAVDHAELERTHLPFYEIVRKAHPTLPIILITRPDTDHLPEDAAIRKEIILRTYRKAIESGDKNVYFIDGATLFGTEGREYCTVDGSHPNDMGFYRMAQTIYPVLKKALGE